MLNLILVVIIACLCVVLFVSRNIYKDVCRLVETWYLKADKDLVDNIDDVSVLYTEEELLW